MGKITITLVVVLLLISIGSARAECLREIRSFVSEPLVDINHETGLLDEYTGSACDDGDLSVDASAALAGTDYGLKVVLDDTNKIYAYHVLDATSTTGVLRVQIDIDPNGLSMVYLDEISFAYLLASDGQTTVGSMQFFYMDGYNFRGAMLDDDDTHYHTQPFPISDGPHRINIQITRATNSLSKDGRYETWIDGVKKQPLVGIDNYHRFFDFKTVSLGANSDIHGISGIYYLDELIIDDNRPGPVDTNTPTSTPTRTNTPTTTPTPTRTPTRTFTPAPSRTPTFTLTPENQPGTTLVYKNCLPILVR